MDANRLVGPTTFRRSSSEQLSSSPSRSIAGDQAVLSRKRRRRRLATKRNKRHKKKRTEAAERKGEGMGRVIFVCAVLILSGVATFGQGAAPVVAPAVPPECVEMKTRLDRAETK